MLREIGGWLAVNGEAVYESRPWKVFGEGPTEVVEGTFNDTKRSSFTSEDIRFTTKAGGVYAIVLDWPEVDQIVIRSLSEDSGVKPTSVTLLGHEGELVWKQGSDGLMINLPGEKPCEFAVVFKVS